MSNQESGRIKQLKLRVPMELYKQLIKDAEFHHETPSAHARHILLDALMRVELTEEDKKDVERMIAENWTKIRGGK